MKVYCKNCKYIKFDIFWQTYSCKADNYKVLITTPIDSYYQYANPHYKNINNDCKEYKPKLIRKIYESILQKV
jgi:hypothetical protein